MSNPSFELIRTIAEILKNHGITEVTQVGEPFLNGDRSVVQIGMMNTDVGLLTVELSAIQLSSDLTEAPEAALQRMASEIVALRHAIVQFAPEKYRPSFAAVANHDEFPLRYVRKLEETIARLREDLDLLSKADPA